MAWVCGACGQSNWISKWLCRGCNSHQTNWTSLPKPPAIVAKDRQTYAQAAARGALIGKGGKGKGKVHGQAAHPSAAVPRPPAPPMTPTEEVASLVRGSKSWRKAKILELQCMESMLADSKVYDAHSVGFMQNKVENIRLELREAQPIHRRIAGVTDALTKNRKRHILAAAALAEAVAAERAAGERSLELEAELRRLHTLQVQASEAALQGEGEDFDLDGEMDASSHPAQEDVYAAPEAHWQRPPTIPVAPPRSPFGPHFVLPPPPPPAQPPSPFAAQHLTDDVWGFKVEIEQMRPQLFQHGAQLANLSAGMTELHALMRQTLAAYVKHSDQPVVPPPVGACPQPLQAPSGRTDSVVVLESPCQISATIPCGPAADLAQSQLALCVGSAIAQGVQLEALAHAGGKRQVRAVDCHSPPRPHRGDRSRSPIQSATPKQVAPGPPVTPQVGASWEGPHGGFCEEEFPPDHL